MAITIHQSPQSFTPSDNDVLWVFSSNQTGEPNFSFKVELFVNDVKQTEEKIFPISGNRAYYNSSNIIRHFFLTPIINNDISVNDDLLTQISRLIEVKIKITEVYGDPVSDEATLESSVANCFKASLSDFDFIDFNHEDYEIGSSSKLFMSYLPRNINTGIDVNQNGYAVFYNAESRNLKARFISLEKNGTAIDEQVIDFGTKDKGVYVLNFSPKHNAVDLTDAFTYEYQIRSGESLISETITKEIKPQCTVSERTVYFINSLGGVDQFLFDKRRETNNSIERKFQKKKFGRLEGNDYNYDGFDGVERNYFNKVNKSISLLSDWMLPDVKSWLLDELLKSPIVWVEDENDVKQRIIITNTSERVGDELYEEWVQLQIDFRYSLTDKSANY